VHFVEDVGDLQIECDDEFQRREWRMERVGWAGLALFVIAAGAGSFGGGPLSDATATDVTGKLVVEYERFVRASASSALRLHISPEAATDGEIRVWADAVYLRDVEVSSIVPAPTRVEHRGERVVYVFAAVEPAGPSEIVFRYEPSRAGRLRGHFALSEGTGAAVRQFAFF